MAMSFLPTADWMTALLYRKSIKLRLLLGGGLTLLLALFMAGWALHTIFERSVERRVIAELETDLLQLVSGMSVDATGNAQLERQPGDQRYDQPLSGLYWQMATGERIIASSRSLWDEQLTIPNNEISKPGTHHGTIAGPDGKSMLMVARVILVKRNDVTHSFTMAVAVDQSEVAGVVSEFRKDMALALGILGAFLFTSLYFAARFGLAPLEKLRTALAHLHTDGIARLPGGFPSEVTPLIDDLNLLMDRHDQMVTSAQARAADLAHGLKTPLTALNILADELQQDDAGEMSLEIKKYVHDMQRYVERELAIAQSILNPANVETVTLRPLVERMVSTMQRLPRGESINWNLEIDSALKVKIGRNAISEILGNLLDNARKWANEAVNVQARLDGKWLCLEISDDGPGVFESELSAILKRGMRLDETAPGSGFGLAITLDVVEQLGGRLELSCEQGAGLTVIIALPASEAVAV
ncbi:MAG: HAMP domain-containing sensor histidine kinase [Anderseniella sp.]